MTFLAWLIFIIAGCWVPVYGADMRVTYSADVKMRDGTPLAADVYLPKAEGQYPAILYRTPYNPRNPAVTEYATLLTRSGYAFVVNHCRGRYDSPGEWIPYRHEPLDSFDTVEWVAAQPWCNGRIGMTGASYSSFIQLQLAALGNRRVQAMFLTVAPVDLYLDIVYPGGAYALQSECTWLNWVARHTDQEYRLEDWERAYRHLPLTEVDKQLGRELPVLQEHMQHFDYDDYWKELSVEQKLLAKELPPMFLVGGWNDPFVSANLRLYKELAPPESVKKASDRRIRILIGPWDHLGSISGLVTKCGDVDYGPGAKVNVPLLSLEWFNHWLKDEPTSMGNSPLKYFVGGADVWKEGTGWPPAESGLYKLYLHGGGPADRTTGDGVLNAIVPRSEAPDSYIYDPADPVPTPMSHSVLFSSCPRDARKIESRKDVLVYSSKPLESDLSIAGEVKLSLKVSTDAPDTDFVAWLTDVFPDGRSIAICDGVVRCGSRAAVMFGDAKGYTIELGSLAHVFRAGHRIRLDVSSSSFPAFERNLNTGGNHATETSFRVANQTVYHDAKRASYLVLPLVSPAVANSK